MRLRAHIPKHFIPARMVHRLFFGKLALLFLFTHRRVVRSELAQIPVPEQIQPRIAYVSHRYVPLVRQRERQHTSHALPFLVLAG